jgi:tetratricopeptide (TPR) repeat protein
MTLMTLMTTKTARTLRNIAAGALLAALSLFVTSDVLSAQKPRTAPQKPDPAAVAEATAAPVPLARAVRFALGHGNVDEARRLVQVSKEPANKKTVATALVAIYEGKDEDAIRALTPLTEGASADDEAILELGLLEERHGKATEADALLQRIIASQSDLDTDGFLRLARAADATGDVNLANSVFQRIGSTDTDRPDVQSQWGDLFMKTHANAEAARSYQDALRADDAWIPALLGNARALAGDDPKASDEMLATAQKLAPKSPDVAFMIAERLLSQQDFAGVKATLDKAAAYRATTIQELSLRAAATYATGAAKDAEPMVAQAAAVNPHDPQVLRALGDEAGQLYRFDDAVAFARAAVKIDPDAAGPHADLGSYLLRTGEEAEARVELEAAFKADPYDNITFNLLQMLDLLDKFTVIEDGEFVFKMSPESAPVLKEYAIPLAKQAYEEYSQRYGFRPKGPIYVEIFDQHDSFAVRTIGDIGIQGALGACFGTVIAMDSPKARNPLDFSWQATLWHEIAHVFTLQLSDYKVPRWLTEGLSQYEEHRHSAPWGRELTMQYAREMAQGKTFTFKDLSESFKHSDRISMAYFEASLVAEQLEALGGTAALQALLKSYAAGANDTEAFTKAFGKTVPEIEASFRAFTDQRFGALRDALKDPAPKVAEDDLPGLKARAAAMPGNYIAQTSYAAAALVAQQTDEAKKAFERAAALAPPAGGEDGPFAKLAEIAAQNGDKAVARQNLRHLLDYNHDDISAARSLAALAADSGALPDLDFALTRMADLDPFEADVHSQLGRRELAQNRAERAILEFQVALALGPANQVEAHTDLGEAFLKAGKKDDAKKEAFIALEQAPTYARAQDLLLAAMGKAVQR